MSLEYFRRTLEVHPELEHIELQGEGEPLLNRDFIPMPELEGMMYSLRNFDDGE